MQEDGNDKTNLGGIKLQDANLIIRYCLPTCLLILVFLLPYQLEFYRWRYYSELEVTLKAWFYTIPEAGLDFRHYLPHVLFGHLYDTAIYFVFIFALSAYYGGQLSQKRVQLLGIVSILPRLLPSLAFLFLALFVWGGNHLHIGLPLPFAVIIGFVILRLRPMHEDREEWPQ